MKVWGKVWIVILFLFSCNTLKKAASKKAMANRVSVIIPTMTREQLTRRAMIDSADIQQLKRLAVVPDRNFKIDSNGVFALADTIYVNAIITNGVLYIIKKDTIFKPSRRDDSLNNVQ
jgi:hypothetical protein